MSLKTTIEFLQQSLYLSEWSYIYLLIKKATKIEFSDVDTPSFICIITKDIKFQEIERKRIFSSDTSNSKLI